MNNLKIENQYTTHSKHETRPQKRYLLRGYFRLVGMVSIIFGHLIVVVLGRAILNKDQWWAVRRRQIIARHLIQFLNIKIQKTGEPTLGNYLYVSNHRSYIDPVVVANWIPFVPIAKAEVGKWLLIGWSARMTGVFYVKRNDKSSRNETREAVREVLQRGGSVLVYPEGTTAAFGTTLPFRIGTFGVAAEEDTSVVPIAIEYADAADAWVGSDSFIPHFLRCFSKKEITVRIHFFAPIFDDGAESLTQKTQQLIDNQLIKNKYLAISL
jgi:lyso-ornithine lipid O-acyltransferase